MVLRASERRSLGGRASRSIIALAVLVGISPRPASGQVQGRAVACQCYCGISVRAPCGDEDCKRACGYREPSSRGAPSGNPAQAIGSAISSGIQDGLRRAREQERIRQEQEQQALEQNRTMMRSLDEATRARVEAEDADRRAAAERERLLEARRRDETLSGMAGVPASGDLALKPSTSFFGIPSNPAGAPPSDPSVVDLSDLPPDRPIVVDPAALKGAARSGGHPVEPAPGETCARTKAARDRLAAGLPVQQEAIRRTEAQLFAASKAVVEARVETRQVLMKGALDEVKGYAKDTLSTARALRGQVEALRGLDVAKRDGLIRALNALAFGGEDLLQAARAGGEGGAALREKQDALARQVKELAEKGLLESGILEKVGEAAAGKLWGPLGELSFRGAKLSIDVGVAVGQGVVSEAERETARGHLETMRAEHTRAKRRISELEAEIGRSCRK